MRFNSPIALALLVQFSHVTTVKLASDSSLKGNAKENTLDLRSDYLSNNRPFVWHLMV